MDSHRSTQAAMSAPPHIQDNDLPDDLSTLAWVQEEVKRSLEAAHKALRRFVKETEAGSSSDVDVVDPAVLRTAHQQIHQSVGALELVGLSTVAGVLRASEAAVKRFVLKPQKMTLADVEVIEQSSFALLDYLQRSLAGKPMSALALFPRYKAVQMVAGADRIHPADLWSFDWQWREIPAESGVTPHAADAASHAAMEQLILQLMRGQTHPAAASMSDVCACLGAGADNLPAATLWKLAAGFFESQALGLLPIDVFSKRVASRLLAQLRIFERGEIEVSDRLAQDMLFFCAQSALPAAGQHAPRLMAVRSAYELSRHARVDYDTSSLGRFDPAWIAQAKKRVASAKDAWSSVAGGEMHRLAGLSEQFSLVGDSLKRLYPSGEVLADELTQAVTQTQQSGAAPSTSLAMEVATSVLYLESSLEDADFDHPEEAQRVRRLAQRVANVRQGLEPDPLEAWMEELYRRVSDRQTMGSVVHELRISLGETERQIDQFFRNPGSVDALQPVPGQIAAMRGVLSVLGIEQATQALTRMREDVEGLIHQAGLPTEQASTEGAVERLAGNLGALGFLIDMLGAQPHVAKSLFVFDAKAGTLSPLMGRSAAARSATNLLVPQTPQVEARLIEQAQALSVTASTGQTPLDALSRDLERLSHEAQIADRAGLAETVSQAQAALEQAVGTHEVTEAREQLSEAMARFVSTANDPVGLDPLPLPGGASAPPAPVSQATDLGDDPEMREVFLEEARETVDEARLALERLAHAPTDVELLTTVRRAFHTFKGSSRMVGLSDFGDAAWACEQLYNTWLAENESATPALLDFSNHALDHLKDWIEAIADERADGHRAGPLVEAAAAFTRGDWLAAPAVVDDGVPAALPLDLDLGLDGEADGDLDVDLSDAFEAFPLLDASLAETSAADQSSGRPEIDLDLDLDAFGEAASDAAAPPHGEQPLPVIEMPLPAPAANGLGLDHVSGGPDEVGVELLPAQSARLPKLDLSEIHALGQASALRADEPPLSEPAAFSDDEQNKMVGPLRISIPLFNIYLNEADELSRKLATEVAEWAMELHRPVEATAIALAHSLSGSSATVGFVDLSHLARLLEHALTRSQTIGSGTPDEGRLFVDAAEEIRRLLHQFAAGFLMAPTRQLLDRLADHEISSALRLEDANAAVDDESLLGDAASELPLPAGKIVPVPASQRPPEPAADEGVQGTRNGDRDESVATPVATGPGSHALQPAELGLAAFKALTPLSNAVSPSFSARLDPVGDSRDDGDDDIDAVDAIDAELFPIFEEEALELLPQLDTSLREWARVPGDNGPAAACMRTLHTLKGGARLAGAMRLGERAHRLETAIEHVLAQPAAKASDIERLQSRSDALADTFEALRGHDGQSAPDADDAGDGGRAEALPRAGESAPAAVHESAPRSPALDVPLMAMGTVADVTGVPASSAEAAVLDGAAQPSAPDATNTEIDWTRFSADKSEPAMLAQQANAANSAVRVRGPLLERMVNQAGEVSITRSRIEAEVGNIRSSLSDLTENLERLRLQLRDIEFQAEMQMASRQEAAKAAQEVFDPLESDRFTRFQELTRMMAESVNDVATVQRSLQRTLATTEDELAAQARLTRDLQDDLLRTRMVEFESLSERLYRVVRQAAKETGRQVRLDILGGSIEVDRGVLDRMTPAFEHLLRNCVTHGIESPERRTAAGKDATGNIVVVVRQEGNEVGVEFRDDGGGLDLARIRAKGVAMKMLAADGVHTDAELANLIFTPGFSTASTITELAGRGVGMDVVRSEVNAMGGRIETATAAGQGTSFKLVLPLTTAVTQVVMLRCGSSVVAVPATLIEIVRRASPAEIEQSYLEGSYTLAEQSMLFFWLGSLLQQSPVSQEVGRTRTVVIVRSAQQRIALHVDEVLGTQEVVVKNLGPQLARLPGLAGMTLLASGTVALIYNPVALATLYGDAARAATRAARQSPMAAAPLSTSAVDVGQRVAPLVLVVDDSLTVRRVTQRLLTREGFRVVLAKDGIEALERLTEERPQVVLSDIEMPRMDGFDLVRNIRADVRLRDLPIIMITSRIAQKHKDHAAELGVDHYLGKPYSEEDLLALIARYSFASVGE